MAFEEKGITIVFRGNDAPFEAAVKKVQSELKQTGSEVSLLNKKLKFDPKNVELLGKKIDALRNKQKLLSEQASILRQRMEQLDPNSKEWSNLNLQLQKAEGQLASLSDELSKMPSAQVQAMAKDFEEWGNKLNSIGSKIEGIGKKLSVLSAGIVGLGTAGVKFNAQLEQYQTAFTTLIGDADKAAEAISRIQQDASKTPFSTESLIEANQYLISAGVEAEESEKMILALGDAIAATGGGSNELSRMAQNLQQIKNLGKASSVDIKQFANAGINIYGLLADTMGITTEKAKEMDVTYEQLVDAFTKASSEGGKYFGAMANQSETLNGSISSLKDQINQLLGELTAELMPIIKNVLQYVRDFLKMLKEMSPQQKAMITRVAEIIALLGPAVTIIGGITSKVGELATGISKLLKSEKVVSMFAKLTSSGTSLGSVLKSIVSNIAKAVGWWGVLIGVLVTLYATNKDVRNAINNLVKALAGVLKPTIELIVQAFRIFSLVVSAVVDVIKIMWTSFTNSTAGQQFITFVTNVINLITKLIGWFKELIGWLGKVFKWFGDLLDISMDFNASVMTSRQRMNGSGYDVMNSGGFMSGGITINNSFNISGTDQLSNANLTRIADVITDRVNENLGRMVWQ